MGNMDDNSASIMMLYGNQGNPVLVLDRFTDTDNTALNLHTPNTDVVGSGWIRRSGTTTITSNAADASGVDINTIELNIENHYAEGVIGGTGGDACGIVARYNPTNGYFLLALCSSGGNLNLYKFTGSFVNIGSVAYAWAYGNTVRFSCNGNSLDMLINGTSRLTATETQNNDQVHCGFRTSDAGNTLDDFEADGV